MPERLVIYAPSPRLTVTAKTPTIQVTAATKTILRVVAAGPPGPPGPAGQAVTDVISSADHALGGHRVVRATATGVTYASAEDPEVAAVLGVTTHAANAANDITIRVSGALTEPSWTWQPGPVYLASNGLLSQIPPTTGAIKEIGVAINQTTLLIRIQPEINLG